MDISYNLVKPTRFLYSFDNIIVAFFDNVEFINEH